MSASLAHETPEWSVTTLGDAGHWYSGGTPSTQVAAYWNGDIPWITSSSLHGFDLWNSQRRVTRLGLENGTRLMPPGTILFVIRGMSLKTEFRVGIARRPMAFGQDCKALVAKDDIDSTFLAYAVYARASEILSLVDEASHGTGRLHIDTLKRVLIPLPPLAEQRAIAAALADVDALLAGLDAQIAKQRALKTAAMQQLLTGQTRLPGFTGEWETHRLGEIVEIISGGTPSTQVSVYWGGPIKWCTPTDITGTAGKYLLDTDRTITPEGLSNSGAQLLPAGSLLLCSRATIGDIKIAISQVTTNQGFKSLVCGSSVDNEFLYYLMLTMKSQLVERAIGSTFLEISRRDVALLNISLPPLPEQRAIAEVLSDMDAAIAALEARRAKTAGLKQAMMQELLTGRIRLR